MTRLESAIRRLEAQRVILDHAALAIAGLPGVVFELGLGNGRTYDHLRQRLPDRRILVFERRPDANDASLPPADDLVVGDLRETLPPAARRFAGAVRLAHADIGCGDPAVDAGLAAFLAAELLPALAPGAFVLCDQALHHPTFRPAPLPAGIAAGRYFLYRALRQA